MSGHSPRKTGSKLLNSGSKIGIVLRIVRTGGQNVREHKTSCVSDYGQ